MVKSDGATDTLLGIERITGTPYNDQFSAAVGLAHIPCTCGGGGEDIFDLSKGIATIFLDTSVGNQHLILNGFGGDDTLIIDGQVITKGDLVSKNLYNNSISMSLDVSVDCLQISGNNENIINIIGENNVIVPSGNKI